MLANLRDVDELPSLQPSVGSPSRPSSSRLPEHEINRADEGKYLEHKKHLDVLTYIQLVERAL